MRLAEPHAVHALDEGAHTLDRPQLGTKSVARWTLQKGLTHLLQLRLFQLCGSTSRWYGAQCINTALIEQRLPRVHRLACHANSQSHFGAALAFLQHSPSTQSLLCCLAQSLLNHLCILQEQACRYNAYDA
jgi:hypothetical protein